MQTECVLFLVPYSHPSQLPFEIIKKDKKLSVKRRKEKEKWAGGGVDKNRRKTKKKTRQFTVFDDFFKTNISTFSQFCHVQKKTHMMC